MQKAFSKPQKKLMTRLVLKCHMSNLGHEFIVSLCNVSIGDAWTAVFCTYFFYQFEKIKSAQLDCFIALVTVLFYGTVSCPFSMMMQCLQNAMQCTTCGYFQSEGPPLASPSSLKHLVGVALWNWAEKSTPNLFRKSKWDLFPSIVQGT